MSEDYRGFGGRLRAWRQSAGLSQEELAARSRLSARTIRNLERGHARWPYPDTLRRLADALELRGAQRAEFMTAPGRPLAPAGSLPGDAPSPPGSPAEELTDAASAGQVTGPARPGIPAPRQLPAGMRYFTGRKAELDFLTSLLDESQAPAGASATVVISAIGGTAGVGKTALAVHWANEHTELFPDGQLYVNLRGFDPAGPPVPPEEAVRRFLEALGVPPARIPAGTDAQLGLYRSVLAGKRVLIVLDNARDAGQVRPLLPGAGGCMVLVTSRSQLTDLVALEGAAPLTVGLLTQDEARELLTRRLGDDRVAREQPQADELISLCGRLPLALNIAAARAVTHPRLPLDTLAAQLRDTSQRLDLLSAGQGHASLRVVLSWSYQTLTEAAARLLRLLSIHPGPDLSLQAAASLAGLDCTQVRLVLDELTGAYLVSEHAHGRYALHDLQRAYATELCRAHESPADRRAALRRALDHYLHTGIVAAELYPTIFTLPLPVLAPLAPGVTPEDIADSDHAMAWFRAEHQVLIAAASRAANAFDAHTMQLLLMLHPYLDRSGHWHDGAATGQLALAAASRLGDLAGQAHAHWQLGSTCRRRGELDEAQLHLGQALAIYQQIEDPRGLGVTHSALEALRHAQNRAADALYHCGQAVKQYRIAHYRRGEAVGLNNIGWSHVMFGDPAKGLPFLEEAIGMLQETGHCLGLAYALDSLGYARGLLGEHQKAISCYLEAEVMARKLGDLPLQAVILDHLGDACHSDADTPAARRAWQQAMDIQADLDYQDTGDLRAKIANSGAVTNGPGAGPT